MSEEAKEVALKTNEAAEGVYGRKLGYARLNLSRWRGRLVVSKVEITNRIPHPGKVFAKIVARSIEERKSGLIAAGGAEVLS